MCVESFRRHWCAFHGKLILVSSLRARGWINFGCPKSSPQPFSIYIITPTDDDYYSNGQRFMMMKLLER